MNENPLDKKTILRIWNQYNSKELDNDIIHFMITKLFMPLFTHIWKDQNFVVNVNDLTSSEKIINSIKTNISTDVLDTSNKLGNIIIENFFKDLSNVEVTIPNIIKVIMDSNSDSYSYLFLFCLNKNLRDQYPDHRMKPKSISPKIPMIPDDKI